MAITSRRPGPTSSERYVASTISPRAASHSGFKLASTRSDSSSAHCRSSSTSSSGPSCRANAASTSRRVSISRRCVSSAGRSAGCGGSSASGSWASAGAYGASRRRRDPNRCSLSSGPSSRQRSPIASSSGHHGCSGRPPVSSPAGPATPVTGVGGVHSPAITRSCRWRARLDSSAATNVLPMPLSPARHTKLPCVCSS